MAPSAMVMQSHPTKMKRPVPPGIQTNGINSSASSPSPSMSANRLPSSSKNPPNSATINGLASNGSVIRSASRIRRDPPAQLLGRGQRNNSVGLRSASIVGESSAAQNAEPQPYVKTDEYILRRYRGQPPSLIIHLHQNHFRFDQQEGSFSYKSPMRVVIEGLRTREIPHELVNFFTDCGVTFYEGCLIIQVHDHKSTAPTPVSNRKTAGTTKAIPFSVHNYNPLVTPSSYVPYPVQVPLLPKGRTDDDSKSKTAEQKDKENMPAPNFPNQPSQGKAEGPPKRPKVMTRVLHPTPNSNLVDFASKALEARTVEGRRESRQEPNGGPLSATVPPTPTTGVPQTPQSSMAPPTKRVKKSKLELGNSNVFEAEAKIIQMTTAPLFLEPVSSAAESSALLESLAHPMHSEKPPSPKARKRTVAEMEADEAIAAEEERYMLILDERLSSNVASAQSGANPTDGGGQAGGASFEPRFERFKALENIKNQHEENKKIEKQRREEAERKARQDTERNKLRDEAEKQIQEKRLQAMQHAARQQQAQQAQEAHRRQLAVQAAQSQQGMQGPPTPIQHAHPSGNGMMQNGMSAQQRFHQQQVSQAPASSPVVQSGTPQSHSSPMVNNMSNVPMQHSTSSMGESPARPGSVVQQINPPLGANGHAMTAQRSQQSHAGTPRLPNSTPHVQSTPLNRQMSQTPRINQGSPLQGQIVQGPQMMMANGQAVPISAQQAQAQAQAQAMSQQRIQLLQHQQNQQRQLAAQAAQGMGIQGQLTPQQFAQMQMMQSRVQQQQQQQQQSQQQAQQQAMAQNYQQARMAAMQSMQAGNMGQNFMGNSPGVQMPQNVSQMQQLQQMQHQQAQQARLQMQLAAQAQAQQQQQQGMVRPQQINPQQVAIRNMAQQIYLNQRQHLISTNYPNGIPPQIDTQLKHQAQQRAVGMLQQRQQMMAMQQNGMEQGMSGMQNGMGM